MLNTAGDWYRQLKRRQTRNVTNLECSIGPITRGDSKGYKTR